MKFSSLENEVAFLTRVVNSQSKELNDQSARLRAAWIERERLKALLKEHNIDLGTPTPESVPIISKD